MTAPHTFVRDCCPDLQNETSPETKDARLKAGGLIADAFMKMLFLHNFAHGDLHPGNILVRGHEGGDDAKNLEIVLIDAGIVTELAPADHENFADLFGAIYHRDGKRAGQCPPFSLMDPDRICSFTFMC